MHISSRLYSATSRTVLSLYSASCRAALTLYSATSRTASCFVRGSSAASFCSAIPSSLIAVSVFSLILFALVPISPHLALHPSPLILHPSSFTFPFAHASYLHCTVNVVCLFTLVRVLTWRRCLVAYLSSVAASLIPGIITSPTLGFSAILFWFYGYSARHLWRTSPSVLLSLIPMLVLGFFLPWIAARLHLLMFALGFLSWHLLLAYHHLRLFFFDDAPDTFSSHMHY